MAKHYPDPRESESMPSRLDELTQDSRPRKKEENKVGWRRNFLVLVAVLLAAFAAFLLRHP
ncbi:hypothetical protein [Variovorax rhizosphaerae]|uniref:Uncharacterized protein n=1 Tax=Variovorax rhizosphaerae TaxID=1836200 RepID=A0ABU8WWI3_9BURK